MEIGASNLHINLVRNCTEFLEEKTGARICCPVDSNCVLVRGSLEEAYYANEMLTVCICTCTLFGTICFKTFFALQGITPIYLQFQPSPEANVDRILKIAALMGISVSIGKTTSGCDEFIFSTYEWNASKLSRVSK